MLVDGRAIAAQLKAELAVRVAALRAHDVVPRLAIVVATADEGAAWYVRSLLRAAAQVGAAAAVVELPADTDAAAIEAALATASADPDVHGVLCQTPLPAGVRLADVAGAIDPAVDIDGANPLSLGRLAADVAGAFPPATAAAAMRILEHERVSLTGARAVVIGRSTVVGKPLALMLLARHATVTVCHSRTVDLPAVAREADVLVAAVGRPALVTAAYVKPGAFVVDVGTNPTPDGGLVGDVDTAAVDRVATVTPVPGGVGPVTTVVLLGHLADAAERSVK